jgi:hypothetical protein
LNTIVLSTIVLSTILSLCTYLPKIILRGKTEAENDDSGTPNIITIVPIICKSEQMSLLIYVTFMTLIPILKVVLQWKSMKVVYCLLTEELSLVAKKYNDF